MILVVTTKDIHPPKKDKDKGDLQLSDFNIPMNLAEKIPTIIYIDEVNDKQEFTVLKARYGELS